MKTITIANCIEHFKASQNACTQTMLNILCHDFQNFATEYTHIQSKIPTISNGFIEQMVQTIKNTMVKAKQRWTTKWLFHVKEQPHLTAICGNHTDHRDGTLLTYEVKGSDRIVQHHHLIGVQIPQQVSIPPPTTAQHVQMPGQLPTPLDHPRRTLKPTTKFKDFI